MARDEIGYYLMLALIVAITGGLGATGRFDSSDVRLVFVGILSHLQGISLGKAKSS